MRCWVASAQPKDGKIECSMRYGCILPRERSPNVATNEEWKSNVTSSIQHIKLLDSLNRPPKLSLLGFHAEIPFDRSFINFIERVISSKSPGMMYVSWTWPYFNRATWTFLI